MMKIYETLIDSLKPYQKLDISNDCLKWILYWTHVGQASMASLIISSIQTGEGEGESSHNMGN